MWGRWVPWWEVSRGTDTGAEDLVEPTGAKGNNTWNPGEGAAELACPLTFGWTVTRTIACPLPLGWVLPSEDSNRKEGSLSLTPAMDLFPSILPQVLQGAAGKKTNGWWVPASVPTRA